MPVSIYTLGYARWSIDAVAREVELRGAMLADIRQSPHTTKPGFSKQELAARFGARYEHVSAFGNEQYQGDGISLTDPERGCAIVARWTRAPLLMCGCRSPAACHRSTVAALLSDRLGGSVTHLRPPSARAQPGLFDT